MPTDIAIRFAGTDDINIIGFLAQQIWPSTYKKILSEEQLNYMMNLFYSPGSLQEQMIDKKHSFLIVEENEEPIGFASYSTIDEPGIYKIHKIYVLPDQQGKGLGKLVINFIIDNIKESGARALQLNVNRYNKAKFFYEKLGFEVIREEDVDIGNNYFMNDYVMEKKLNR
jgi:ribosomal protein S18 acetylase RimI-like enzyme